MAAPPWAFVILGRLGDADTVCGLFGQDATRCGARPVLLWLGSQAWFAPTILFIGLVLMLLGERKARSRELSEALGELNAKFGGTTADISKSFTALEGRVAHCEEAVRELSGEVREFRSVADGLKEEVGAVTILLKEKAKTFETIETFALRSYKALDHHLNTRFEPWINQVTERQDHILQEFRMFNDHAIERLERLEVALAERDIVPLPDTTDKPVRM